MWRYVVFYASHLWLTQNFAYVTVKQCILLVIKVIEVIIQTTIFCREKWMYSAENCVSVAMFYALAL